MTSKPFEESHHILPGSERVLSEMQDCAHEIGGTETLRIPVDEIVTQYNVLPVAHDDTVPGRYAKMPFNPAEDFRQGVRIVEMRRDKYVWSVIPAQCRK